MTTSDCKYDDSGICSHLERINYFHFFSHWYLNTLYLDIDKAGALLERHVLMPDSSYLSIRHIQKLLRKAKKMWLFLILFVVIMNWMSFINWNKFLFFVLYTICTFTLSLAYQKIIFTKNVLDLNIHKMIKLNTIFFTRFGIYSYKIKL